jgi:hypothetical protein
MRLSRFISRFLAAFGCGAWAAGRHPVFALGVALVFAVAATVFVRAGSEARARAAETDPVKISERALAQSFNRDVAEREIRAALAAGDTNLAQSFVELAADRNVPVDPALADETKQVTVQQASLTSRAGRFVRGL